VDFNLFEKPYLWTRSRNELLWRIVINYNRIAITIEDMSGRTT